MLKINMTLIISRKEWHEKEDREKQLIKKKDEVISWVKCVTMQKVKIDEFSFIN